MKRTYRAESFPNLWKRIEWYNRKFWPWILLNLSIAIVSAVIISFFVATWWSFIFGVVIFITGYMNASNGMILSSCDHIIYEVSIDDEQKEVVVKYCMILKWKRVIPFGKLHTNVAVFTRKKGVRKQSHLFIFQKTMRRDHCLGSIKYPCSAFPWNKTDIYKLSQDLYKIKLKNKTWKPDEMIYVSPLGTPVQGKWAFTFNNQDEIG